jgi:hypothetical protein
MSSSRNYAISIIVTVFVLRGQGLNPQRSPSVSVGAGPKPLSEDFCKTYLAFSQDTDSTIYRMDYL